MVEGEFWVLPLWPWGWAVVSAAWSVLLTACSISALIFQSLKAFKCIINKSLSGLRKWGMFLWLTSKNPDTGRLCNQVGRGLERVCVFPDLFGSICLLDAHCLPSGESQLPTVTSSLPPSICRCSHPRLRPGWLVSLAFLQGTSTSPTLWLGGRGSTALPLAKGIEDLFCFRARDQAQIDREPTLKAPVLTSVRRWSQQINSSLSPSLVTDIFKVALVPQGPLRASGRTRGRLLHPLNFPRFLLCWVRVLYLKDCLKALLLKESWIISKELAPWVPQGVETLEGGLSFRVCEGKGGNDFLIPLNAVPEAQRKWTRPGIMTRLGMSSKYQLWQSHSENSGNHPRWLRTEAEKQKGFHLSKHIKMDVERDLGPHVSI